MNPVTAALDFDAQYDESLFRTRQASVPTESRYQRQEKDFITRFYELVRQWRMETAFSSRVQEKIDHPAFRQIAALGAPAIPLIIRELRDRPDFLFIALQEITGENPTPPSEGRRASQMVEVWLSWVERNNVPAD